MNAASRREFPLLSNNRQSLELVEGKPKGTGRVKKAAIVDCHRNALPLLSEKFYRCQMEGIQGTDGLWERLQGSREHRRGELNKCDAAQQGTYLIRV